MSETGNKAGSSDGLPVVPKAVVARLSLYLRELQHLLTVGRATISSSQLGQRLGFTDAQVRKDLAYFGQFGYPGVGYRCEELVAQIRRILGTGSEPLPVALIGAGHLGHALLNYRGFSRRGFRIVAAFDVDSNKVGQKLESLKILPMDRLEQEVRQREIRLAVLAVPTDAAQQVGERLVRAGVVGILNFAPMTLKLPEQVAVAGVDLAIELEQLSFAVVHREANP